jgi:hypothetical protein
LPEEGGLAVLFVTFLWEGHGKAEWALLSDMPRVHLRFPILNPGPPCLLQGDEVRVREPSWLKAPEKRVWYEFFPSGTELWRIEFEGPIVFRSTAQFLPSLELPVRGGLSAEDGLPIPALRSLVLRFQEAAAESWNRKVRAWDREGAWTLVRMFLENEGYRAQERLDFARSWALIAFGIELRSLEEGGLVWVREGQVLERGFDPLAWALEEDPSLIPLAALL